MFTNQAKSRTCQFRNLHNAATGYPPNFNIKHWWQPYCLAVKHTEVKESLPTPPSLWTPYRLAPQGSTVIKESYQTPLSTALNVLLHKPPSMLNLLRHSRLNVLPHEDLTMQESFPTQLLCKADYPQMKHQYIQQYRDPYWDCPCIEIHHRYNVLHTSLHIVVDTNPATHRGKNDPNLLHPSCRKERPNSRWMAVRSFCKLGPLSKDKPPYLATTQEFSNARMLPKSRYNSRYPPAKIVTHKELTVSDPLATLALCPRIYRPTSLHPRIQLQIIPTSRFNSRFTRPKREFSNARSFGKIGPLSKVIPPCMATPSIRRSPNLRPSKFSPYPVWSVGLQTNYLPALILR